MPSNSNPNQMCRRPSKAAFKAVFCAAAFAFSFIACSPSLIREERYEGGAKKSQSAYLAESSDIRHGLQMTWYSTGIKESMETFVRGYRQGYAFRWHPNGRMKSVEHYTDGLRDGQAKFWDESGILTACSGSDAQDCLRASTESDSPASRLASSP